MLLHFQISLARALLLAAMICLQAGNAFAAELIASKSYVVDATSQKSFEQIVSEVTTPYTGVLSRGYTNGAIWMKLEITPPADAKEDDEIVLRIRPVYLDEISLFDPLDKSGKARTVGDAVPITANEFTSLSHTFVIPAGDKPRAIWLRVKATSTSLVSVEAMTRGEMMRSELALNLADFGLLAIVGMFAMLVLINWVNNRESLYALFVVRQIYYFFYTASLFGIHRLVFVNLTGINLDTTYSWLVVIATALSFYFEYRFLNEYSPPKWAKAVLCALICWSFTAIALMLFGQVMDSLRINMLLNTIGSVTLLVLSILFIDAKKVEATKDKVLLSKRMVVSYYATVTFVLSFSLLPYLGWVESNEFPLNGLVAYTLCSGLFMTALMQHRANKQKLVQDEYEKKLMLSDQAVTLEKKRREEQTHLFHMLMHELKTPLSIIDMALLAKNDQQTTSDYVGRAVGNMKDILERCVKADKLTEGNVDIRPEVVNLNQHIRGLLEQKANVSVNFLANQSFDVVTDIQFLTVMLSNLLDNAERYGDKQEAIELVMTQKQNEAGAEGVSVTISNRPSAASWPDPERVFSKYYRSAGAEAKSGTGLGLYLVRTLARLVGGDCLYVPNDKYIRFELWLPS
jgi:signal transduction histidine kinase